MGNKFYDHDTILFVHRVLQLPQTKADECPSDMTTLPPIEKLTPLDSSEGYMLQASVEVVDGNNPELKDRALRTLMTIKETLKQSVVLVPGDRLALDTRLPVAPRRP